MRGDMSLTTCYKAGYNNETARSQAATVALAGFRRQKLLYNGLTPVQGFSRDVSYLPKRVT